jgi:hypothetical protein
MLMPKRSYADRRSGKDRRKRLNLSRFFYRGSERRGQQERRSRVERRAGWVMISKWSSVFLRDLKISKYLK